MPRSTAGRHAAASTGTETSGSILSDGNNLVVLFALQSPFGAVPGSLSRCAVIPGKLPLWPVTYPIAARFQRDSLAERFMHDIIDSRCTLAATGTHPVSFGFWRFLQP